MRGFEIISKEEYQKHRSIEEYSQIVLPKRATSGSAGYDFFLPYKVVIEPGCFLALPTGIKAYMNQDEVLLMFIRSSLGYKGLFLRNQVGVIDSDYYNNPKNEGHIFVGIENTTQEKIVLNAGDRIVQGIFVKYLKEDNETLVSTKRVGGIGSTKEA
jgi:dUTP pyrophosphatase